MYIVLNIEKSIDIGELYYALAVVSFCLAPRMANSSACAKETSSSLAELRYFLD